MNERIQQLAEQAGFLFWTTEHWGPGPGNIDWSNTYQVEFNAFAELLIDECAKVAREHTLRKSGLNSSYDGTVLVEEEIRDHFKLTGLTPLPTTEESEIYYVSFWIHRKRLELRNERED